MKDPSAVRGGPVFELMFNVDRLLRRRGLRESSELTFFAPMASPGARMGARAVEAIGRLFGSLGIATRFGKKIDRFLPEGVLFEDRSMLASDLVVFLPVGDAAELLGPDWRAKQGHLAEVMARTMAANVRAMEEGRPGRESYLPHLGITCLLDMGNGAAYVHRDGRSERMIPLPWWDTGPRRPGAPTSRPRSASNSRDFRGCEGGLGRANPRGRRRLPPDG